MLRFVLLGALLFAADAGVRAFARTPAPAPAPPGTPLSDEELLFRAALARGEHASDPIARQRLLQNARFALGDAADADAAIALGMHESDPVVRRRLVQKAVLRAHARARRAEPSEVELRTWFERHASRWRQPPRVRLRQDAATPLPLPHELPSYSEEELAGLFGPAFARAVFSIPVGAAAGPIESAYASHRVTVLERTPSRIASFDAVRGQVREALLAERGEAELRREIERLRRVHGIPAPAAHPRVARGDAP